VSLAVDDRGLEQLLAEPYDATPWYALAVIVALIGVGFGVRFARTAFALRRLFTNPQASATTWNSSPQCCTAYPRPASGARSASVVCRWYPVVHGTHGHDLRCGGQGDRPMGRRGALVVRSLRP
jgi:hypothetical protein